MVSRTFEDLSVGDSADVSRTITEKEVEIFADITGDVNPVHMDEAFAKETIFGQRIAHGILVSGLISAVLGNELPGSGSIYLAQNLKFLAPVNLGDTITARVEVIEKIEKKKRVVLQTTCTNQEGKVVIAGQAVVLPRRD